MSSNGSPLFELRHMPGVGQEIKNLAKKAGAAGCRPEYLHALREIVTKLQYEPTKWGDPEYDLNKPGGCVYHGVCCPLFVQYAIFEREKIVMVMKIQALPQSVLE